VGDHPAVGLPMYVAAYAKVEKGPLPRKGAPQVLTVKVQQVPGAASVG